MDESLIEKQNGNFANTVLGAVPSVVYNEDCVEGLKRFTDNYFDLAIVDPPYTDKFGTKNWVETSAKQKGYDENILNNTKPKKDYWDELFRVSKNQIVWGGNYFELPISRGWIVWHKMDVKNYFSPCELAWTSFDINLKYYYYLWCGMYQQNMKDKEKRIHISQKPIALYEWLLQNYAKDGDLILDTHLGSGSSRIACNKAGFNFTGFENDKKMYEAQEKRFKDFVSQLRMF